MNKKTTIIICLLTAAVIILAALLAISVSNRSPEPTLPDPTDDPNASKDVTDPPVKTDVALYGVELDAKGNVIRRSSMSLRYTLRNIDGISKMENLALVFRDIYCPEEYDSALICTSAENDLLSYTGDVFVKDNGIAEITLCIDHDNKWYFIKLKFTDETERYFIGSVEESIDTEVIMNICCKYYPSSIIDWTMQAYVCSQDGKQTDSFPITIKGEIQQRAEAGTRLELQFNLPKDFRYQYNNNADNPNDNPFVFTGPNQKYPYYVSCGYGSYDRQKNETVFAYFAIDTQKQCFIITWDNGTGSYLVSAADPNMTMQKLTEHFSAFLTGPWITD